MFHEHEGRFSFFVVSVNFLIPARSITLKRTENLKISFLFSHLQIYTQGEMFQMP